VDEELWAVLWAVCLGGWGAVEMGWHFCFLEHMSGNHRNNRATTSKINQPDIGSVPKRFCFRSPVVFACMREAALLGRGFKRCIEEIETGERKTDFYWLNRSVSSMWRTPGRCRALFCRALCPAPQFSLASSLIQKLKRAFSPASNSSNYIPSYQDSLCICHYRSLIKR
jgi:hypothetical protein